MRRALLLWLVAVLAACAESAPEVDPAYRAEIEAWRAARLERLTSESGWLTLVGLYWLEQGVNRFGADPRNEIPIAVAGVPDLAGTIEIGGDGSIVVRAVADADIRVNGDPVVEAALRSDAQGTPDMVHVGRAVVYIIDRDGRLAARVKDPEAATRRNFRGLEYFPIDPGARVTATLEPYEVPREVEIPTVVGTPTTMLAPGLLHFDLGGTSFTLEPYVSSLEDKSYFLIFRDRTSGVSTYGAGRFLSADAAGADGTTVLDFNLAYNPPCAFTPFATCPLPTPRNSLPVAIEAGEKYGGPEH